MGFRFRLDTVLRYRGRIVQDRSREVATAEKRFQRLDDQLGELERVMKKTLDQEMFHDGSPLHLGDLVAKRRWLEHLGNRKDQMILLRDQAKAVRDQARGRLEEAWRQHEVLDRLRGRREMDYRERAIRAETLAMDEIASVRHPSSGSAISSSRPEDSSGSQGSKNSSNG